MALKQVPVAAKGSAILKDRETAKRPTNSSMSDESSKARIAHSMKGKSRKPPAIKNAALSRYVAGSSEAQLARDLNISEPTVYRILRISTDTPIALESMRETGADGYLN